MYEHKNVLCNIMCCMTAIINLVLLAREWRFVAELVVDNQQRCTTACRPQFGNRFCLCIRYFVFSGMTTSCSNDDKNIELWTLAPPNQWHHRDLSSLFFPDQCLHFMVICFCPFILGFCTRHCQLSYRFNSVSAVKTRVFRVWAQHRSSCVCFSGTCFVPLVPKLSVSQALFSSINHSRGVY